jgi:hypothetical protein
MVGVFFWVPKKWWVSSFTPFECRTPIKKPCGIAAAGFIQSTINIVEINYCIGSN